MASRDSSRQLQTLSTVHYMLALQRLQLKLLYHNANLKCRVHHGCLHGKPMQQS